MAPRKPPTLIPPDGCLTIMDLTQWLGSEVNTQAKCAYMGREKS